MAHCAGDHENLVRLLEGLWDQDAEVRKTTAKAAGEIGHIIAVPGLLGGLLRDLDAGVRKAAATALGRIGSAEVEPVLVKMREGGEMRWALGKIGDVLVVPALTKALRDPDAGVRRAAGQAIRQVGSVGAGQALVTVSGDAESRKGFVMGEDQDPPEQIVVSITTMRHPGGHVRTPGTAGESSGGGVE